MEEKGIVTIKELRETFDELSLIFMELENALLDFDLKGAAVTGVSEYAEKALRLRILLGRIWATEIIKGRDNFYYSTVKTSKGENYIEIEFPYELITKTTLYRIHSRELAKAKELHQIRVGWSKLMADVLLRYDTYPFETPLLAADVVVTVLFPTAHKRDADHFWFRPVLDGLFYGGIILNDYAEIVNIIFKYAMDREHPAMIVQVCDSSRNQLPDVRESNLTRIE